MTTNNTQPFNNVGVNLGGLSKPGIGSGLPNRNVPVTFSAGDYILSLFKPDDPIAIMLLRDGETPYRYASAQEVASYKYQAKLQHENKDGWNIYVCMSPLHGGKRRVKENVEEVRAVFIDIDANGQAALDKIAKSTLVPKPHFVLESSPGKFQVIWSVDGIAPAEQEVLNKAMVQEFGGDPAATDMARVLRLPGFINHKYESKPVVRIIENNFDGDSYTREDFKVQLTTNSEVRAPFMAATEVYEGKGRNTEMFRLASSLRAKGLADAAIRAGVIEQNQAVCHPPLDAAELETILDSALRTEYKKNDADWREKHKTARAQVAPPLDEIDEPTAYGAEPAERSKHLKELEFHSSFEKLQERAYVLGPNPGERNFGQFRLGQVSVVAGSSGSNKTTAIIQMMVAQKLGADFFGYKTHGYPFVLLSRDRNQDMNDETMDRMNLALAAVPFTRLPKNVWGIDAAQAIVDEIEKLNPMPKVVFIEGIDMLAGGTDLKDTTYFTGLLEDIAQHFQIAVIVSAGSPKEKKNGGYPAGRDNILGSSGWGRTIDALWLFQFTKDGDTSVQRTLTIYPRNSATRRLTLGLVDGQLEIQPDPVETVHKEHKTVVEIDWFKKMALLGKTDPEKKWWTVVDIEEALSWSQSTADRHVRNAHKKRWIVKKAGAKAGRGRGGAEEYQWNDSNTNPLWVAEQTEIETELSL